MSYIVYGYFFLIQTKHTNSISNSAEYIICVVSIEDTFNAHQATSAFKQTVTKTIP